MGERTSPAADALRDQAESWFVRLRADDCSAEERRAFEVWRAAAPEHADAYSQTERFWRDLGLLASEPEVAGWRAHATLTEAASKRRPLFAWAGALSVASVAVAIAIRMHLPASESARPLEQEYATAPGEQRELTLEDGTHLSLNTNTRIQVHIDGVSRGVALLRGEVLFDVTHDAKRPFHVRVGDITITDLGTSFDIHNDAHDTQITLISGRAEVTRGSSEEAVELAPGDQLISNATTWRKQSVANLASVTDWSSGHLVFRATPLRDVVAQINRHGPGRLVIADRSLESVEISGDFRIGNTQALVRALQSAFPIRAEVSAEGETRLYARR